MTDWAAIFPGYGNPRLDSIAEAKANSDIDGYGDEGAGYDMEKFASELERMGWVFRPDNKEA